MNNRKFLTNARAFLVAAMVACRGFAPDSGAAETVAGKPNVVLILLDDFGYECLAANGGESYKTPVMDKLAATGVRFEQCHAQPLCTPTRVQLMTGMSNRRNYTRFGHLDRSQTTFAHLLKKAGYETCVVGKWQLEHGFEGPGHFGFDEYCLWQLTRRPSRYKNPGLEVNGQEQDYTQNEYGPDIQNEYALDFITRKKDKPFFLYYPMTLPHFPADATPDSPDYDKSPTGKGGDKAGHFPDMVAYIDKLLGKLVAKLEELDLRDNTLILILGDNGTEKGVPSKFQGREILGGKGLTTMWGTRVPCIGNWPGRFAPGRVSQDLIDSTDFLPTICEAADVPIPADLKIDGRSFFPQLCGRVGQPREWLYSWYARGGGAVAQAEFAHDAQFKLYSDGRFHDLKTDELEASPLEDHALSADAKAAKARLQAALAQYAGPRPEAFVKEAGGGEGRK